MPLLVIYNVRGEFKVLFGPPCVTLYYYLEKV